MPETSYASCGDLSLAYQVFGGGPVELVFAGSFVSHVELFWTLPQFEAFFEQLSTFCRVLLFDKAGVGLSDPVPKVRTLDDRAAEIEAVTDAVGFRRPNDPRAKVTTKPCGVSNGASPTWCIDGYSTTQPHKRQAREDTRGRPLLSLNPIAHRMVIEGDHLHSSFLAALCCRRGGSQGGAPQRSAGNDLDARRATTRIGNEEWPSRSSP